MRNRVEKLVLWDVTLDIEELTQYDGQGRCRWLDVRGHTRDRDGARLRGWAADKGWRVAGDDGTWLKMMR